ncbi:hypothetical protein V6O07_12955, partial [Arthrospira platensis SPKY2]
MAWLQAAQNSGTLLLSPDETELDTAFVQSQLTYRTVSPEKLPLFVEALGRENLGVTTLPAGEFGDAGPLIRVSGFALSYGNELRIPAVLDFIRYMTGQSAQQQMVEQASLLPSNASVEMPEGSLL